MRLEFRPRRKQVFTGTPWLLIMPHEGLRPAWVFRFVPAIAISTAGRDGLQPILPPMCSGYGISEGHGMTGTKKEGMQNSSASPRFSRLGPIGCLGTAARLSAAHALEARAIAHQGELFAVLTGIAFISLFFGFLPY